MKLIERSNDDYSQPSLQLNGLTLIEWAIDNDDQELKLFKALIKLQVGLKISYESGNTLLHKVCMRGKFEHAKVMCSLAKGRFDIN